MSIPPFLRRALSWHMRDENLDMDLASFASEALAEPALSGAEPRSLAHALERARASGAGATLALELGATAPLQALGMVGELIAHSPTLRSAFGYARKFLPLLQAGGSLKLVESDQFAVIYFEPGLERESERRFAIEMAFAMMVAIGRHFVGKSLSLREVLLPYPAPKHMGEYEKFFPCPVSFDASAAALIVRRPLLDVRQPLADDYLRKVIEGELERALRCETPRGPLNVRVRAILERDAHLLSQNTLRVLPKRLGLSLRAVRRRLAAEGLTLSGLVMDFRKEQAIHLVVERDLPFKSIADKVGFSDATSFHRAFKRWTGATPKEFRRRARPRASAASAA